MSHEQERPLADTPRHAIPRYIWCHLHWLDLAREDDRKESPESKVSTLLQKHMQLDFTLHLMFRKRTRGACGSPVRKGGDIPSPRRRWTMYPDRQQGRLHRHNTQTELSIQQNRALSEKSPRYWYLIWWTVEDLRRSLAPRSLPSAERLNR